MLPLVKRKGYKKILLSSEKTPTHSEDCSEVPASFPAFGRFFSPVLKVHKHEIFFLTFFAETESLWSQGPVTRDFLKIVFDSAEIFDF
jgi:hypothetical protein